MKRLLLLPLLLGFTSAVNAESYYLLVAFGERIFTEPMKSLDQCEEQLAIVTNTDNWKVTRVNTKKGGGICIDGK